MKNIENLRLLGDEAYSREDYKEAFKYYTQVIEVDINDYERKFRRILSSAWIASLNDCKKINGSVSQIANYCKKVSEDTKLTLEEQEDRILSAFNAISEQMSNMYNGSYEIHISIDGTTIASSYLRFMEHLQFAIEKTLELISVQENFVSRYPNLHFNIEMDCISAQIFLNRYPTTYIDTFRGSEIFHSLSEIGRQKFHKMEQSVLVYSIKYLPNSYNQLTSKSASATQDKQMTQTSTEGCYIATSVYGSYDCPQVLVLRRYRDDSLSTSWQGLIFIKVYYAVSPLIVKVLGNHAWFNRICKVKLDKIVFRLQNRDFGK